MNASRSRPLAAFWLLAIAIAVVMAQGLREDAARVLVSAGVPAPVAGVLATDMVLGEQLQEAPARATRSELPSVAEARVSTGPTPSTSVAAPEPARHPQSAGHMAAGGAQASPTQSVDVKPRAQATQQATQQAPGHAKGHAQQGHGQRLWQRLVQRFEERRQASLRHHVAHGKAHAKKHHAKRHHRR